ncbi:MAG: extracellular solute-binding protein [Myxococcota bacterium]
MKNRFRASNPAIRIDNPAENEAPNQRDRVAAELLAGATPSTFQANLGSDLLQWAKVATEVESENLLTDLSSALMRTGLRQHLPDVIANGVSTGKHRNLLAVPLNIHRINVVYYDVKKFKARFGDRPFFTIDELCPSDPSTPPIDAPIAIGRGDDFSLLLLTFEAVLPALTNGEFYNTLMRGEEPQAFNPSGDYVADLDRAFQCVQYLSRSFVTDSENYTWAEALTAVRDGDALFTVTGDWGNLQLKAQLEAGLIAMVPFPGSENTFVYTSDTFPLPVNGLNPHETLSFLEYMANPATQAAFSDDKGSIPARTDAPIGTPLHELRAAAHEAFFAPGTTHALATSGINPPYYARVDLAARLRTMVSAPASELNKSRKRALAEFLAAQPLLRKWQEQLAGE